MRIEMRRKALTRTRCDIDIRVDVRAKRQGKGAAEFTHRCEGSLNPIQDDGCSGSMKTEAPLNVDLRESAAAR